MFRKMNLQARLMTAFLMMGLIVFAVAGVGWSGNQRLSRHTDEVIGKHLPSVSAVWKIIEGQTRIQSGERLLFDPRITQEERQAAFAQIKEAWEQIGEGIKQYEDTSFSSKEEEKLYKKLKRDLDTWKQVHQRLVELEREFQQIGIQNPWERRAELLSQGKKENSPEMAAVRAALALRAKMDTEGATREEPLFKATDEDAAALLKLNDELVEQTQKAAAEDVSQSAFWVIVGMVIGPLTALIFGIALSVAIAKPLDRTISGVVNAIVSSATEIAATVEQHERIAAEQATSVNQTTATMDELSASSRQAAEQAEAAAAAARQVAQLVVRLSEQTRQIGSITNLVSELASQTNMLALNAAVEAVRAGQHGKGFAVVASEIRRLADESKKSALNISNLIAEIRTLTDSAVVMGDEERRFEGIVAAVSNIVLSSQQISHTAKQQAVAVGQVLAAMNAINAGAQQTASGISQTKAGTQKLQEAALNLKALGAG